MENKGKFSIKYNKSLKDNQEVPEKDIKNALFMPANAWDDPRMPKEHSIHNDKGNGEWENLIREDEKILNDNKIIFDEVIESVTSNAKKIETDTNRGSYFFQDNVDEIKIPIKELFKYDGISKNGKYTIDKSSYILIKKHKNDEGRHFIEGIKVGYYLTFMDKKEETNGKFIRRLFDTMVEKVKKTTKNKDEFEYYLKLKQKYEK